MQISSCYRVMQSLEFSRSYMFYLYLFPSVYIISSRYKYIDCIYIITSYHSWSLRLPVFPISLFSLPSISISTSVYWLLLFVSFSVDIYIYLSVPTSSSVSRALSLLYAYFQLLWRHNSVTQQSFGFIQRMEGSSNAARLLTDTWCPFNTINSPPAALCPACMITLDIKGHMFFKTSCCWILKDPRILLVSSLWRFTATVLCCTTSTVVLLTGQSCNQVC